MKEKDDSKKETKKVQSVRRRERRRLGGLFRPKRPSSVRSAFRSSFDVGVSPCSVQRRYLRSSIDLLDENHRCSRSPKEKEPPRVLLSRVPSCTRISTDLTSHRLISPRRAPSPSHWRTACNPPIVHLHRDLDLTTNLAVSAETSWALSTIRQNHGCNSLKPVESFLGR